MQKVRFRTKLMGRSLDVTCFGEDDKIVNDLREYVVTRIPNIPFTGEDDKLRAEIDPDGKGSLTNADFFKMVIDLQNKEIQKAWDKKHPNGKDSATDETAAADGGDSAPDPKVKGPKLLNVPKNSTEFIALAVQQKIAEVVG